MDRAHSGSMIVLVLVLIFAVSCDRRPPTPKTQPHTRPSLDSYLLAVTPLADGGAYVTDLGGAVWYVREGRGMRVTGLPEGILRAGMIPTADGGAYMTGSGLWYLREGVAIKVQEVPTVPGAGSTLVPRDQWLWALLQSERLQRDSENDAMDDRDER